MNDTVIRILAINFVAIHTVSNVSFSSHRHIERIDRDLLRAFRSFPSACPCQVLLITFAAFFFVCFSLICSISRPNFSEILMVPTAEAMPTPLGSPKP